MHAPSHARQAFVSWVEQFACGLHRGGLKTTVITDEGPIRLELLSLHLWNCTDELPAGIALQAGYPRCATYASLFRRLKMDAVARDARWNVEECKRGVETIFNSLTRENALLLLRMAYTLHKHQSQEEDRLQEVIKPEDWICVW